MTGVAAIEVRARSVDAVLLQALDRGLRARVHSVFARAVNVVTPEGALLTLVDAARDDAPDTLVADADGYDAMGLRRDDPVVAVGGVLALGACLRVRFDRAQPWVAWLPAFADASTGWRANVTAVAACLASSSPCSVDDALHEVARRALAFHAAALVDALAAGDAAGAGQHATSLLGLGPGLTPSGDDLLVGLLAVLAIPGSPARRLRGVRGAMLARADERTHLISLSALRAAAQGRVRAGLATLLDAMLTGTVDAAVAALAPVLAIGATSGRDICDGVLRGFEVQRRLHAAWRRAA